MQLMESEIEEECVEVAAFIYKTNSEFLEAAAAWAMIWRVGLSLAALLTPRLLGQVFLKEQIECGKTYGKRYAKPSGKPGRYLCWRYMLHIMQCPEGPSWVNLT